MSQPEEWKVTVDEGNSDIYFTVETSRKLAPHEFAPLWQPGGVIFQRLVAKGFLSDDGTTLLHFKMEEVKTLFPSQEKDSYETVFRYYLASDEDAES